MADTSRAEMRSAGSTGSRGGTRASNQDRRGFGNIDDKSRSSPLGRPVNTAEVEARRGPSSRDVGAADTLRQEGAGPAARSDDGVTALQVHDHGVMAAYRAGRGTMPSQLLFDLLLLFVSALNLFEGGGKRCRVNAHRGRLSPRTAPRANSAAKSLVHGAHCPRRGRARASPECSLELSTYGPTNAREGGRKGE